MVVNVLLVAANVVAADGMPSAEIELRAARNARIRFLFVNFSPPNPYVRRKLRLLTECYHVSFLV